MFELKGKVAIVTGGNGGIGKGIVRGLAALGCDIVVAARNKAKIDTAVNEVKKEFNVKVLGVQVDMNREEQIKALVAKSMDRFNRIDILVNNAGTGILKRPEDYETSEWDEILSINLRSVFICSKAVYPVMKQAGAGKIINIGSMLSIFGGSELAAYGASKGGVVQLTKSLAVAWAPDNIQVNALLPGWIETDLVTQVKDVPEFDAAIIARTPANRWGMPDELAGAAVFLASPASNFVTGTALPVDGGYSVMV